MGKRMTQKELEQLYWLNREIESEQARLMQLNGALFYGKKAPGLPQMDAYEREAVRGELEECRVLLQARIERAAKEYRRLCEFIDSVEDSLMRQILSFRYINGLPWQQVAFMIGEKDEQSPRRWHNLFLKRLAKEKDNENHVERNREERSDEIVL